MAKTYNRNIVRAYKKKSEYGEWYAVVECGYWKMIPASCSFFKRKEDGMVFNILSPILNPPDNLQEWDEIRIKDCRAVELTTDEGIVCEGWDETENNTVNLLYKLGEFAGLDPQVVKDFISKTKD
jgi:hypothetical protein